MTDPHLEGPGPTPVTIFGRTYQLRGGENRDYLEELATLVDRKMREIADGTGTADTLKVAILAALNIADERFQAQRGALSSELEDRLGRLVALLDEALVA